METIFQGIVDIINALPAGPYFVFETPFPALEQISEGNTNFGSTFGDLNLGSTDILDVDASTDESIHISGADLTD